MVPESRQAPRDVSLRRDNLWKEGKDRGVRFQPLIPISPSLSRSILAVVRSERQEDYITFPHLAALMIDREGEREEREGDGLGGKKRLRRGSLSSA